MQPCHQVDRGCQTTAKDGKRYQTHTDFAPLCGNSLSRETRCGTCRCGFDLHLSAARSAKVLSEDRLLLAMRRVGQIRPQRILATRRKPAGSRMVSERSLILISPPRRNSDSTLLTWTGVKPVASAI